jgi:hypothetical protein
MITFNEFNFLVSENWNYIIPCTYDISTNTILIYKKYFKICSKANYLSYIWIIYSYGMFKYINSINSNINYDICFPENEIYKYAFSYMFYYYKNYYNINNFYYLTNNDDYLNRIVIKYCQIKTYFDNCEKFLKWEIDIDNKIK